MLYSSFIENNFVYLHSLYVDVSAGMLMNIICFISYCRNRFLNLTWNDIEPLQGHCRLLRFLLKNYLCSGPNLQCSSAVSNSSEIFEIWQWKHNIFVIIIKQTILISFVVCRYVYTCSGIIVIQIELSTGISMKRELHVLATNSMSSGVQLPSMSWHEVEGVGTTLIKLMFVFIEVNNKNIYQ